MGCGPSNSAVVASVESDGAANGSKHAYPPSEAFEIPLDDEHPESLIKKHPPLRLKRLEEHPTTPPSIEDLEEKLATAEIRRQQFLASRVQKTTTLDKTGDEENDDLNAIKEGEEPGEGDAKPGDIIESDVTETDVNKNEENV